MKGSRRRYVNVKLLNDLPGYAGSDAITVAIYGRDMNFGLGVYWSGPNPTNSKLVARYETGLKDGLYWEKKSKEVSPRNFAKRALWFSDLSYADRH